MDRRDDRRRQEDPRDQRTRNGERDRSRSPPQRDRRDDRRRERSPYRGAPRGPPSHRERDYPRDNRNRQGSGTPPPANRRGDGRGRPPQDNRSQPARGARQANKADDKMQVDTEAPEGEDEEARMARLMGFKDFRSTKNTKVPGNDKNYAVSKKKKTEYRQYMNRVGGFNRALSPSQM